jgi:hypothetical protein
MLHDLIILIVFIEEKMIAAPHIAVYSDLLPLYPSSVKIFPLALSSQTNSVYEVCHLVVCDAVWLF